MKSMSVSIPGVNAWRMYILPALVAGLANTGFTYQGQLVLNGTPVTGACTFRFDLFDVPVSGISLGTVTQTNVPVASGLFTVILDFGVAPFDGNARYLEIAVDCGGGLTVQAPRQKLEAVPYAVYSGATRWGGLMDKPAGFADDVDNDTTYKAGSGLILTGITFSADTNFLQKRVTGLCDIGSAIRVVNIDGTVTCETDTDTVYSAGTSLILSGTTFSADTNFLQKRVTGQCNVGSFIRVIDGNGTVTCDTDTDT